MLASGAYGYPADYLFWVVLFISLIIHTWCFFKFSARERRPRLRLVLGNVLVFACLLGFVALLAETYLRFACVQTDSFGTTLPARKWFALYTDLNSLGCRDVEWTRAKPPGERRIACVGDSFVYGWGVEDPRARFTGLLQAKFDRRQSGTVEVMNVAKPGWDTGQQLQPVKDLIEYYDVDEILLGYVANDIEKILPIAHDLDPTKPPMCRSFNTDSSVLVEFLYYRLIVPHFPTVQGYHDWLGAGYAHPELWHEQQQRLQNVIDLCRAHDVNLRVVLLPFLRTGGQQFDLSVVHAQVREFLLRQGVPVLDLLPVLAGRDPADLVVNSADAHPNERAHSLFADAIWTAFYAQDAGSAAHVTPEAPE